MNFEVNYERTIGCGPYNFIMFFLLTFQTFKQAIDFQGLNFALYRTNYTCNLSRSVAENGTQNLDLRTHEISEDQCFHREDNHSGWSPCKVWTYENTQFKHSLVSELNLVCQNEYYRDLMYTLFFVGILVAFPVSLVSDKVGRRPFLLSSLMLSIPITIGQIFSYTIWLQLLLSFLSGFVKSVCNAMAMTTLTELTTMKYRELSISNYWTFYTCGYITTVGLAYAFRSWRMIYVVSLLPMITYLFYFCCIPESPRWLLLKGRKTECFNILTFITKLNKRSLPEKDFDSWEITQTKTGSLYELFRSRGIMTRAFIIAFMEWSFGFSYMGTSTDLHFASNNPFISSSVMGIIELPTGPTATLIANKLGRRLAIVYASLFGVVCLLIMPFLEMNTQKSSWQPWIKVLLAMGGKFGFTSAWCVSDLYNQELIPTTNRSGVFIIVTISVGIGTIFAPTIHDAATKLHYAAPCLIYSSFLIATVTLILLFLPETKGHPLSQTIQEALSIKGNKIHNEPGQVGISEVHLDNKASIENMK